LRGVERKLPRTTPAIKADLAKMEADYRALAESLNKIRVAMNPPNEKRELVDVVEICNQARTAVDGRLQEERIDVRITGARAEVMALPDWLRQVFLNLFLNSIDAFRAAKRQGRRINVVVEKPMGKANEIEITYHDNAGGINPRQLQVPHEFADMDLHEQIFAPGVTSKAGGSGFGLWLVRRILDRHEGSIDLVDHRQGVAFKITLPRPTAQASETNR
jgi:two-component system sensor histidine kinase HydH